MQTNKQIKLKVHISISALFLGTFPHTCRLRQLPEAGRTSCVTAPLIPERKFLRFTLYVWGWHITHSSRLRNCVGLSPQTAVQENTCSPNKKPWQHSPKDWGSLGDVCLLEALGATTSPAEAKTPPLLHQQAMGLLVLQGWRCFSARGRP